MCFSTFFSSIVDKAMPISRSLLQFFALDSEDLKAKADSGNVDAQSKYGLKLLYGQDVKEDPFTALRYLKLAADSADPYAQLHYSICLIHGHGIKKNEAAGQEYFSLYYKNPKTIECETVFTYDFLVSKIGKEIQDANEELKKARNGDSDAMFQYGCRCLEGLGVRLNKKRGIHYIKKAAKAGNKKALQYFAK